MKSPLNYQITENQSGGLTVFNCVSFLFDRDEMPLEFLRIMASYSLGCYDEFGNLAKPEFYENLLFFASSWLNDYAKDKRIPLKTKYLTRDDVNLLEIRKCLLAGGCVALKTFRRGTHYVTVTGMDNDEMFIFDPYFRPEGTFKDSSGIKIIMDKPFYYNRKIKIEKFISEQKSELVLGSVPEREAVLFFRNNAVLEREFD